MENRQEKEENKRLANFNRILNQYPLIEAPPSEKELTGIRGFIEAFERPLREIQMARKNDKNLHEYMGQDDDFELKL